MRAKKITQNVLTATLGAAIALGGFHLTNNYSETKQPSSPTPKWKINRVSVWVCFATTTRCCWSI